MQIPGQLTSTFREELRVNWLWTVVFGLVVAGCTYSGLTVWRDGGRLEWPGALVVGLMALGWLALAAWTIRRQLEWKALGEATLVLKPSMPVPGQALVCNIQFERRPEADTTAAAELSCESVTRTGLGQKRKTQRESLWRERKTAPSASMMFFTFHPPAHLPPDSGGGGLGTFWWLQVTGKGASRFSRRFGVPMQAPTGEAPVPAGQHRDPDVATEPFVEAARAGRPGTGIRRRISLALGLLFGAVVLSLIFLAVNQEPEPVMTENGLDAGTESFEIRTEGLSGELRLGDLRHRNIGTLSAELRGRYTWNGRRLEIRADDIQLIPRHCAPDCPKILGAWLTLTSWHDLGGGTSSGDPRAQGERMNVDYAAQQDQVISLGHREWVLTMEEDVDPRAAALMLHVETQGNEQDFGLAFGGAEWQGLERSPGDPQACARLQGPVAAIDHFCTARLAELLPEFAAPAQREHLLIHATRRGNLAAVDLLLTAGTPVDTVSDRGFTALMEAASGNLVDVMARLVEGGARIDYRAATESGYGHPTPLGVALLSGSEDGARLLVRHGASLELAHYGSSPVHVAVEMDVPGVLRPMKDRGADLDQRAAWGNQPTPLMAAAGMGKLELVDALLALGADPAAADSAGNTARDYAATHAQAAVLKRLASFPGICPLTGCGT